MSLVLTMNIEKGLITGNKINNKYKDATFGYNPLSRFGKRGHCAYNHNLNYNVGCPFIA